MATPSVLCLGEMLWDCLADRPGLDLGAIDTWTAYPGGAPANVACALPKLGVASALLTCLGSDGAGDRLVDILRMGGVNLQGLQRHPDAPTREVYVLRDDQGDRHFAAFGAEGVGEVPSDRFADAYLDGAALPPELFEGAQMLVLGTLGLACPASRAATFRALDLADEFFCKIFLDVNWRPIFWSGGEGEALPLMRELVERVDFLKMAREEALLLFETDQPERVRSRHDHLEGVLITDGDRGCRYAIGSAIGELAAFAVPVRDTTGAGDAFVAAFIRHLLEVGLDRLQEPAEAHRAVTYASAAGALTTLRPGAIAAQPNHAQVEAFLYSRGILGAAAS